jgi:hypothetical protein
MVRGPHCGLAFPWAPGRSKEKEEADTPLGDEWKHFSTSFVMFQSPGVDVMYDHNFRRFSANKLPVCIGTRTTVGYLRGYHMYGIFAYKMFCSHLVYFVVNVPFWYIVPRKIWQP